MLPNRSTIAAALALAILSSTAFTARAEPNGTSERKTIYVLGGGYAGLEAAMTAAAKLAKHPNVDVILVDSGEAQRQPPNFPKEAATGVIEKLDYLAAAKEHGFKFTRGKATWNSKDKIITIDGVEHPYTALIVATGSVQAPLRDVKAAKGAVHDVRTDTATDKLHAEVESRLKKSKKTLKEAKLPKGSKTPSIVVIGGGAVGAELGAWSTFKAEEKDGVKTIKKSRAHVYVVSHNDKINPLGPATTDAQRKETIDVLKSLGVQIRYDVSTKAITKNRFIGEQKIRDEQGNFKLDGDGKPLVRKKIIGNAISVNTTGFAGPTEYPQYIPVNSMLQQIDQNGNAVSATFIAGDVANILDPKTRKPVAKSVANSIEAGSVAGENAANQILRQLTGENHGIRTWALPNQTMVEDLGPKKSVGTIQLPGKIGQLIAKNGVSVHGGWGVLLKEACKTLHWNKHVKHDSPINKANRAVQAFKGRFHP